MDKEYTNDNILISLYFFFKVCDIYDEMERFFLSLFL